MTSSDKVRYLSSHKPKDNEIVITESPWYDNCPGVYLRDTNTFLDENGLEIIDVLKWHRLRTEPSVKMSEQASRVLEDTLDFRRRLAAGHHGSRSSSRVNEDMKVKTFFVPLSKIGTIEDEINEWLAEERPSRVFNVTHSESENYLAFSVWYMVRKDGDRKENST